MMTNHVLSGLSLPLVLLGIHEAWTASVPTAGCTCISNSLPPAIVGAGEPTIQANVSGNLVPYPAYYGNYCGKQPEPGSSSCWNLTTETELPADQQADFCNEPWCYVDPCTCPGAAPSFYFPGAGLYYSYSNCGGTDPFSSGSQVIDAGCVTEYIPVNSSACELKMSNAQERIRCFDDFGKEDKCILARPGGPGTLEVPYPPTYGEGCGIHLEPGASNCSDQDGNPLPEGQAAAWCRTPWSYVNPCTCDASDIALSAYFDNLYYSYSVCGGTDTYTQSPSNVDTASVGCPAPPPPPVSPMNWPFTGALEQDCECLPVPEEYLISSTDSSCEQGTGKCANASGLGLLTANYGASCGVHAELFSSSCSDDTGKMWADQCEVPTWNVGCRALWCDRPWCYVDPCKCKSVSDIALSAYFPTLYYSYQNCQSVDAFTPAGSSSVDLKEACSKHEYNSKHQYKKRRFLRQVWHRHQGNGYYSASELETEDSAFMQVWDDEETDVWISETDVDSDQTEL